MTPLKETAQAMGKIGILTEETEKITLKAAWEETLLLEGEVMIQL